MFLNPEFTPGGPSVTGDWTEDATARKAWRSWIGLYGSDEKVTVRLVETSDGRERDLALWGSGREVEVPQDPPA